MGGYYGAWFLEIICYGAVNLYALSSGYVLYKDDKTLLTQKTINRFNALWLQVVSIGVIVVFILSVIPMTICSIGVKDFIRAIFPITFNQYWYFSSYAGVLFFSSFLNRCVNRFKNRNICVKTIIWISFFVSILSTFTQYFGSDFMDVKAGYSLVWLAFMYVIGASIRKYNIFERINSVSLVKVYALCSVITWGWLVLIEIATKILIGSTIGEKMLIAYNSPTILVGSVCLFVFFTRINTTNKTVIKILGIIVPSLFSVYLIHTQPVLFNEVFKGAFEFLVEKRFALLFVLLYAGCIFTVCLLLDFIRRALFRVLHIDSIIKKISDLEYRFIIRIAEKITV